MKEAGIEVKQLELSDDNLDLLQFMKEDATFNVDDDMKELKLSVKDASELRNRTKSKTEKSDDQEQLNNDEFNMIDVTSIAIKEDLSLIESYSTNDSVETTIVMNNEDNQVANPTKSNKKTSLRKPRRKDKRFPCTLCGKLFSRRNHVKEHQITTHMKEKNWKCDLCGDKFVHRQTFNAVFNLNLPFLKSV